MYRLYQKQSKTLEYPLGVREIPDGENPFINGPCLFCFSPQEIARHVFGVTKVGMEMARMRVRGLENAGFNIDTVSVSFLTALNEGKGNEQIDAFVLAKDKLKGLRNYKLSTVSKYLEVNLVDAHRALNDVIATAEVFLKLY